MDSIKIYHSAQMFTTGDFSCRVNGGPANITYHGDHMEVEFSGEFGVHELSITQLRETPVQIEYVMIGECHLRENIYLSYSEHRGVKTQPSTATWGPGVTWVLPFGVPVSNWHDLVLKKLAMGELGGNLYEKYDIYYPLRQVIPGHYPRAMRDFFQYDFDFTVVNRRRNIKTPVTNVNLPSFDTTAILELVKQHYRAGSFSNLTTTGTHEDINQQEDSHWTRGAWRYWNFIGEDMDRFPEVKKELKWAGISDIYGFVVAFLEPRTYVYPHRDEEYHERYAGACQLYIPLNFTPGNYFKLAGVGSFESGERIRAYNVSQYTHAVINETEHQRIALIVRCSIPEHLTESS